MCDESFHSRSIKHYFLMDLGDFFVQFMDLAEDEMKKNMDGIFSITALWCEIILVPFVWHETDIV